MSLKGSASHFLKNTAVTADNFQKAWDSLVSFYENKRLLVNSALHSLLTIKRMNKECATELESLYTTIMQIYRTLETLGRKVHTWDDFLVFVAVQRLDSDSVKAWEHHLGFSKEPPTWQQFSEFLMTRLLSLKAFEKSRSGRSVTQPNQHSAKVHHASDSKKASESSSTFKCSLCSSDHYITSCPEYINQTEQHRLEVVKKNNLCFNCLGQHRVSLCRSAKRCIKCGKKHHSTIHKATSPDKSNSSMSDSSAQVNCSWLSPTKSPSLTLLATAQVIVISEQGERSRSRALIDPGSQISVISECLAQRLHLPRQESSVPLHGIGAVKAGRTRGLVSVKLKPHFESSSECLISAHVLSKVTSTTPSTKIKSGNWPHLNGLRLADTTFQSPGRIDLIIGADYYGQIMKEGLRRGSGNAPAAQSTIFGWVIFGPSGSNPLVSDVQSFHVSVDQELYELLQRFWQLDEMPSTPKGSPSAEDQECEDHFVSTHFRDETGRYVVRLPLKKSVDNLGDSKTTALRMLSRLSKKLQADPFLKKAYSDFLNEYENLQHMRTVPTANPEAQQVYYLPHHGVTRTSSLTTKLRVVFNASSRTSTGVSLNDLLYTGAKLQTELFDVLTWFRQFRYVFTSDIEKMYKQIKVHPMDWDLQRILWRAASNEVQTYQLTTVTYGLACAPFLALRTMQQLIADEGSNFPLAVPILNKGRYVDDVFGGADSIQRAQEIVQQVDQLCLAGGFPLQKWTSNEPDILQSIPAEKQLFPTSVQIDQGATIYALGMCWNPSSDTFTFTLKIPSSNIVTKRSILSTIARLFDPLGFLSPIIIKAKVFIQELWTIKLDWDDALPAQLANTWSEFLQHLPDLHLISVPRWLGVTSSCSVEVHGFCDASRQAIAAVTYVRSIDQYGNLQISLICSKTKIAPLKRWNIPRLELPGAVLLTKLVRHLLQDSKFAKAPIYLWTDSAITHTWINNHPSRWKEFVYNRVCFIQESIPTARWRFVPGKENPADCATRGLTPSQLSQHHVWWTGPNWLKQPDSEWPNKFETPSIVDDLEERPAQSITVTVKETNSDWDLLHRYSSLNRLLRITALCKRYIQQLRTRMETSTGATPTLIDKEKSSSTSTPITVQELEEAKSHWIKTTQLKYFHQEYKMIMKGELLLKSHCLTRLTPFIDSQGLIRLGGRLQASLLPSNTKHPLILPRDSIFTRLVISDAHQRTLHGSTQDTLSFIKNNYWIVGGRAPIRSFIWKCVKCVRYRQKRAQQLMGQLPKHRVTPSRPFLHSGVDYAGPLLLKTWRGRAARTYKSYITLFVCHSTSAIHLELVTDYTAESFIAAYKRFTTRKGICATLRSDCGTNLKGADAELQRLFSSASKELRQLSSLLASDGTHWIFNPPAAPHFGGKWEAGVKSVKYHLRRVIGDHLLTYEEMTTLLTQIEAVLNSRPLSPLSDDPEDLAALTSGHFLIGGPPTIVPEPSLDDVQMTRLSRWQLLRQMLDSFWTRWSKECLQRYQTIYKWNQPATSLQKGSLALVMDERYPPSKWPLGRILDAHPGKDGHTRVMTIRTQSSTFKRPITKICPLPVETDTL